MIRRILQQLNRIRRIRRISLVRGFLLVTATATATATANGQRPTFGSTLFWESGLINVPTAFVAPVTGDLWVNYARISFDSAAMPAGEARTASYNMSLGVSIKGRVEAGISVFSADLRNGLFAKALLWDQMDGAWRRGFIHWLPSIAAGIRNVGSERTLDRNAITTSGVGNTSPTFYGVATRTFALVKGETPAQRPKSQVSVTGGWGNGIFLEDGGLGKKYAAGTTGGIIAGASLDFESGRFSTISLMAERDGWGTNVGARGDFRGVRVSLMMVEVGGSTVKPAGGTYAGPKFAMSLGWQTNFWALLRGNRLEQKTQQLETEQQRYDNQVKIAQQQITAIQGQIEALRSVESREKLAERAELERRLREEQEALRRLQELIKAREAAAKKPPI